MKEDFYLFLNRLSPKLQLCQTLSFTLRVWMQTSQLNQFLTDSVLLSSRLGRFLLLKCTQRC